MTDLQQLVKNIFRIDDVTDTASENSEVPPCASKIGLDALSSVEWKSVIELPGSPVTYHALHTMGLAEYRLIAGTPSYKRSDKAPFKR